MIEENNGIIKDVENVDETVVLITLFSCVIVVTSLEVDEKVVFDIKAINKGILALELDAPENTVAMEEMRVLVKLDVIRTVLASTNVSVTGNARVGAVATVV